MAGLLHAVSKQKNPLGTAIRTRGSGRYTFGLALSAGLAGLLYGYDTVSISGAIEFLRTRYRLDTVMEGLVISSIMLGAVLGAACAGFLSDRLGRRRVLIAGGWFFCVAAVWSACTFGPHDLIVARVVGGFGIGLTSALAVTYITESAPAAIRGTLTFSYQMLAVCGIFLTNVINYIIASYGTPAWDLAIGWRWMLGLGAVPALVFLLAMWHAPESPRFLIQTGRTEEGFRVLEHILGTEEARVRADDIQASARLEDEMSSEFSDLFRPGLTKALWIGLFLAVFNQAVGINAISYYGPVMFSRLGFGGDTEFLASACVGGIELVFTVIGLYLIDTIGRKKLMATGAALMTVFAMCIAAAYVLRMPLLILVCIMLFAASFAFSMGPIPWVVIPELFPTFLRGRATGLCVMCLLATNWLIAQFTPMMMDNLGGGLTFLIFGLIDLGCLFGIIALVPETMGRTLEEIDHLWQPKTPLAAAKYRLSSADANIRHAEATMARVENERLQAMGIMQAAERARIEAQKQIFEIEMEERRNAERLSAERRAEEERLAAHTVVDGLAALNTHQAGVAAPVSAPPSADDGFIAPSSGGETLMSGPISFADGSEHRPDASRLSPEASAERAQRIAANLAAGVVTTSEFDDHVRRAAAESSATADDGGIDDTTAVMDDVSDPPAMDTAVTNAAGDADDTDPTRRAPVRRGSATCMPAPLPNVQSHAAMLARQRAEDEREAKAIDDALDTLDSFIKN